MVAQGEEICAVTKADFGNSELLPDKIVVKGTLNGKEFVKELPVEHLKIDAGYLPRQWAKLELDRLLAEDADKNKQADHRAEQGVVCDDALTPRSWCWRPKPTTSSFKVDRGRKDHWAMYQCPDKIPVVFEPNNGPQQPKKDEKETAEQKVLNSILVRTRPEMVKSAGSSYIAGPAAKKADYWYLGAGRSTNCEDLLTTIG